MPLVPDLSTEANREFWAWVAKTAKEAREGDWQKGAICRRQENEVCR